MLTAGCSEHSYQNPCPTNGSFTANVALDGGPIVVAPWGPLDDPTEACDSTWQNPASCQPPTLQFTIALEGSSSPTNQSYMDLNPVQWTDSQGNAGVCSGAIYDSASTYLSESDGGIVLKPFCDLSLTSCSGGTLDATGFRISRGGPYGTAIEVGASQGQCCWRGSGEPD